MWTSIYAINQSQVQRYISCKTLRHAKMWVFLQCNANKYIITVAVSPGSCTDKPSFTCQVFVCEHGRPMGNCESGCVFWPHHVFHLQELWPVCKRWYKHPRPGNCSCNCLFTINTQTSYCLLSNKALLLTVKMVYICEPDAALPRDGYSGRLPWNPWLVCGCCIQWYT